jgi:sugar phosphate isomerase/epimerase
MSLSGDTWPIAAAMLQFPSVSRNQRPVYDADPSEWAESFVQIGETGFDRVEINDNWLRVGDLTDNRLDELAAAGRDADMILESVCIVRSSVIDPLVGAENLAYSHRTLEAAARLGAGVVSVGFHRPLTAEQRERLWFWTAQGEIDEPDDVENWQLAVDRITELGRHAAELGLELTLEMYEDTYLGTGASSVRLVTEVGLDNVGLNPDVGNLVRLHRPIDDWQETLRATLPYANYWHVKNYARDEDPVTGTYTAVPTPLELGLINYRHAVSDALALGFRGTFVCEHYGGDGLSVSALNRDYLRRVLPAAIRNIPGTPSASPAPGAADLDLGKEMVS